MWFYRKKITVTGLCRYKSERMSIIIYISKYSSNCKAKIHTIRYIHMVLEQQLITFLHSYIYERPHFTGMGVVSQDKYKIQI